MNKTSLTNKQIEEITSRIYSAFSGHLDINIFDKDDWKQEIRLIIVKCLDKYDINNKSEAGFYTYAYQAFSNHLNNLNKKYVYKVQSPCNKRCPFYVPVLKHCFSENIQQRCVKYSRYQEALRACLMLDNSDDQLLGTAEAKPWDIPKETINDMIAFLDGDDCTFFTKTVKSILHGARISHKNRARLVKLTRQYLNKRGL